MNPPTVFVSYSHDSPEHKLWVMNLATRLRTCGVDAILDQWDLGLGGDLPQFMEQNIADASRVLMICTERYVQKANAGEGGVGYEKMVVTSDLMKRIGSTRIIPAIRQRGTVQLPTFLATKLYVDFSLEENFEAQFDNLLRDILKAPLFVKPPLGLAPTLVAAQAPKPSIPTTLDQFLIALARINESWPVEESIDQGAVWEEMGGSKLHFEHARDLAVELELIRINPRRQIWINPEGRSRMIALLGG